MSKIILFGAGVYAKKYKALLEYLNMDFDYFTDNDRSKWGGMLYDKPIISPDKMKEFDSCRIIISCTHEISIRQQLKELKLDHKVIGMDELYELCEKKKNSNKRIDPVTKKSKTVIVDMYEGIGWGGSELWAAQLARLLADRHMETVLVGGKEQPPLEDKYESLTVRITEDNTINQMVSLIEENLPCTFINNFAGCGFLAAALLKKIYPDKIKIISVIHNDNKSLFDAHMLMAHYVDAIFCVSNQIREHMSSLYSYDYDKYFFKEQPIEVEVYNFLAPIDNMPLRIGYAARLVKQQKRADLLIDLIKILEEKNINYLFQIAGDGECLEIIQNYIRGHKLLDRVELLGRVVKSKMSEFWKRQDVFVNISEYEGTSLSMLEAMSYNCVPVVTDVSGAKEFISHGINGFICQINDFSKMAEYIEKLSLDRKMLQIFGKRSREVIVKKCNVEEYITYWTKYLI